MYRILLVDDEEYALEGLKHGVDFRELGFEKVYTAGNVVAAKEILLTESVDVILCDIEMPGGSGLELLSWIRELGISVVALILTCHADFEYSRKALQLGSIDYVLKPVAYEELKEALKKALGPVQKIKRQKNAAVREKLFIRNRDRLSQELWNDMLTGELSVSEKLLEELFICIDKPFQKEYRYRLFLIDILFSHEDVNAWEDKNVRFAIRNMADEILIKKQGWVFWMEEFLAGIIFDESQVQSPEGLCESSVRKGGYQEGGKSKKLEEELARFFKICRKYLECYFNAFYAPCATVGELPKLCEMLLSKAKRQVLKKELTAYLEEDLPIRKTKFPQPDPEQWENLMKTGTEKEITDTICRFARKNISEGSLNSGILEDYTGICMQAAYACAADWKCGTDFLMESDLQIQMNRAFRSREQYVKFVEMLAHKLCTIRQKVIKTVRQTLSDRAKEYVEAHLEEHLSNEQIAKALFLNGDYLSRVFRKETGTTLAEYISQRRIERAKELLLTTAIPVSEIALTVGFSSFSYFTKVFKKRTGMEPLKFRKMRND